MSIRILAVEDDPAQQQAVRLTLRSLGYELAGIAATADDALRRFDETQPDLVLLDVSLAGSRDGITLAHELVAKRPVPLIFLTAYPDAITFERARAVGPFAFLGKPYTALLLGHSIELALQHFGTTMEQLPTDTPVDGMVLLGGIFVREANRRLVKVLFDELLVLEADASYTHLHTPTRKHTVRMSLRDIEERLPPMRFVRIHRGHMVQFRLIEALDLQTNTVRIGTHTLSISRSHREELIDRLDWLR
jgi:DNA-binding LytR/AlgR family response regulator